MSDYPVRVEAETFLNDSEVNKVVDEDKVSHYWRLAKEGDYDACLLLLRHALETSDDSMVSTLLSLVLSEEKRLAERARRWSEVSDVLYALDTNKWHSGHDE